MADVGSGEVSRRAPAGDDQGFTLIELGIVVVIIGILVGIAIPTFLGVRDRANEAAAKSRVVTALKTQKTYFADTQQYTADTAILEGIEPSLEFSGAAVLGKVYIKDAAGTHVVMGSKGGDGRCYWTRDDNGVTTYLVNDCTEPDASTVFHPSW